MKKKHVCDRKKMHISDGWYGCYLDAETLSDLACISIKHAYRIIADPERMTPTIHRLVCMQLFGTVPGWPPGWRIKDGKLYGPKNHGMSLHDVENLSFKQQLLAHAQRDNLRLSDDLRRLNKLAAQPRELRVYVNDEPKPRRVLKLSKDKKTA